MSYFSIILVVKVVSSFIGIHSKAEVVFFCVFLFRIDTNFNPFFFMNYLI